jgi:plastocyanin
MSTPTTRPTEPGSPAADHPDGSPAESSGGWDRLVVTVAAVVAIADIVLFVLIAEVIAPLAMGAVFTAIGIAVWQVRRRSGLAILGLSAVVLLAGSAPFALDHLGHPESGVDWAHSVIAMAGRLLVIVLVVVSLRARSDAAARLVGAIAVGLVGVTATVALVATSATSGDQRQADDVALVIDATAFPDRIVVGSGDVLYVDNTHIFRHTFTVEGTDIDVELPALQAVRIPVDLPAGTYEVACDVPGHESMTTVLVVE